jgi:DNA-binding transcriptional regulator PaaX
VTKIKVSPSTKVVLEIATVGAFIAGSLIFPGLPRVIKAENINLDSFLDDSKWEPFNKYRLREKLKILHKQKMVKIFQQGDRFVIQLSEKGKQKITRYKLSELNITKQEKWDMRWRIVAYDIPKEKKHARDTLRKTLKNLGFFELQKSVYLYPYPCSDVIEFIRELYDVGEHVTLLTVGFLENEKAYKEYFNI